MYSSDKQLKKGQHPSVCLAGQLSVRPCVMLVLTYGHELMFGLAEFCMFVCFLCNHPPSWKTKLSKVA